MFQSSPISVNFPERSTGATGRIFLRNFETLLSQSYRAQIVLDMSKIVQLDATGIDLLLKCIMRVASHDGELKLAAASPETGLILELTQLNGVVEVFESVEAAMESFGVQFLTDAARREFTQSAA